MNLSQTLYPSTPSQLPGGGSLPGGLEPENVPYRRTPPWGEPSAWEETEAGVMPASAIHPSQGEDLHARVNNAWGHEALHLTWHLDDQYGFPPPGAPNQQDFQSGHTSVTVHNQSAEQGWGTDPAFAWPRYPHMENHARAYSWGVARRNGQLPAPKEFTSIAAITQQRRDLMLRGIVGGHRGAHGTVIQDSPTVPHTQNVIQTTPYYMAHPVGAEGVLPG